MRPGTVLALFCCSALLLFADRGVIGSNSVNGKQGSEGSPGYGIQVGPPAEMCMRLWQQVACFKVS
jgi:hypothetical protein